MICIKCGEQIDDGSAVCRYCGAQQQDKNEPKPKKKNEKTATIVAIAVSILVIGALTFGLMALFGDHTKYETIQHPNPRRHEVVKQVVSNDDISDFDKDNIRNNNLFVQVYYQEAVDGNVEIELYNPSEFFLSGKVVFTECKSGVELEAVPPYGSAFHTLACPAFDADADFEYESYYHDYKDGQVAPIEYEIYYFEEDNTTYDYVINQAALNEEEFKAMADFMYKDSVLRDEDGAYTGYFFTKEGYDTEDFEGSFIGSVWVDPIQDFTEIYDQEGNLLQRNNYR